MYAPQKHYHTLAIASRIEAAGPHELVTILYQELLSSLDVTRAALVQGKPDACRSGQNRASSILVALEASLDFGKGGELAESLAAIYRSMRRELSASVRQGQPDRLATLRSGAADLLGAWARIGIRAAA